MLFHSGFGGQLLNMRVGENGMGLSQGMRLLVTRVTEHTFAVPLACNPSSSMLCECAVCYMLLLFDTAVLTMAHANEHVQGSSSCSAWRGCCWGGRA